MARHYLQAGAAAAQALGQQIAIARREQRRTATEVAERADVTRVTLRRVERGDPNVAIGIYFEVATILSVPLFGREGRDLAELVARGARELALLPARVRRTSRDEFDDDF